MMVAIGLIVLFGFLYGCIQTGDDRYLIGSLVGCLIAWWGMM